MTEWANDAVAPLSPPSPIGPRARCSVSRPLLDRASLNALFFRKYGPPKHAGWGPRMRHNFGYFTPEDYYEAVVDRLVTRTTEWLDVGCGRFLFPGNPALAKVIASRCRRLVGVDPDDTLDENPYVHERVKLCIDDWRADRTFDLATLRMVAEHVIHPDTCVASLSRLVRRGGLVVVYTVFKYSPVPLLTSLAPSWLRHALKRVLWRTEPKDTFPVANRLNSRGALRRCFEAHGFRETQFAYLDDCRTLARLPATQLVELVAWRVLRSIGFHYPEVCLLGVYERT